MQADAWRQAFHLPEIILKRDIELGDLVLGFEQSRQMSLNTPDDRMLLAVVRAAPTDALACANCHHSCSNVGFWCTCM